MNGRRTEGLGEVQSRRVRHRPARAKRRYASPGISRSAFRWAMSSLAVSGRSALSRKSTAPSLPTNG